MNDFKLFDDDDGLQFCFTNAQQKIEIRVDDASVDSIALSSDSVENNQASSSSFEQVSTNSKHQHFRTMAATGDVITLTLNAPLTEHNGTVILYYVGDATLSLHGHSDIKISKSKSSNKPGLLHFLPANINGQLDYVFTAEPQTSEETGHVITEAVAVKEKLIALSHQPMTLTLTEEIHGLVKQIDSSLSRFRSIRKKLNQMPNFEALKRKYLIEELESFLVENGYSKELKHMASRALQKATQSFSNKEVSKHLQLKTALEGHPLHARYIDFFKDGAPTPLPLLPCKDCGTRPVVKATKNPKTNKKRFEIHCKQCANKPKEYLHGRASKAIYHWAMSCAELTAPPSSIVAIQYQNSRDGDLNSFINSASEYLKIYEEYLEAYKDFHDNDKHSYIMSIKGKIEHLKDGFLIAKLLDKEQRKRKLSEQRDVQSHK